MAWPAVAALGVQVAGSTASWFMGNQAERERKRNAFEAIRRMDREHAFTLGEARERGAASGFEFESESLQKYLGDMSNEFRRQHDFAVRAAKKGADLGELANGLQFATSLGSSLFQFGSANAWWQGPKPSIR